MLLDREEFLDAIKFLKPIIRTELPATYQNYLHVNVDAQTCVMTSAGTGFGKRATLFQPDFPLDIEDPDSTPKPEYDTFLIDLASLESFEKMCQRHKKDLAKSAKNDMTLKFVDIFRNRLESHDGFIDYKQPSGNRFPNLDGFFLPVGDELRSFRADSERIFDVMREFNSLVNVYLGGSGKHIYMKSQHREFEAFFVASHFTAEVKQKCHDYSCRMKLASDKDKPHIYLGKNWTIWKCCECESKIIKLSDYPGDSPRVELPTLIDFKQNIR